MERYVSVCLCGRISANRPCCLLYPLVLLCSVADLGGAPEPLRVVGRPLLRLLQTRKAQPEAIEVEDTSNF